MDTAEPGAEYAEVTENTGTRLQARFRVNGVEGSVRAEMRDQYPPSSPGRARLEITYGDHRFEAYASDGEDPVIRVHDDWGDTVDGWSGEAVGEEVLEDWEEAAAAVEAVVGDVDVYAGTEIFAYTEDEDGTPVDPKERVDAQLDYDVRPGNTSRVQARTEDPDDLRAIMARIEPGLEPLARSSAIGNAWDRFIDGYEDHDFGPF